MNIEQRSQRAARCSTTPANALTGSVCNFTVKVLFRRLAGSSTRRQNLIISAFRLLDSKVRVGLTFETTPHLTLASTELCRWA